MWVDVWHRGRDESSAILNSIFPKRLTSFPCRLLGVWAGSFPRSFLIQFANAVEARSAAVDGAVSGFALSYRRRSLPHRVEFSALRDDRKRLVCNKSGFCVFQSVVIVAIVSTLTPFFFFVAPVSAVRSLKRGQTENPPTASLTFDLQSYKNKQRGE